MSSKTKIASKWKSKAHKFAIPIVLLQDIREFRNLDFSTPEKPIDKTITGIPTTVKHLTTVLGEKLISLMKLSFVKDLSKNNNHPTKINFGFWSDKSSKMERM